MAYAKHEAALFQALLPQLEADGFEVFLHPPANLLPTSLGKDRPDAIALRADKKIAIEVTKAGAFDDGKVERLRKMFAQHDDWELRVIYAPPRLSNEDIAISSRATINAQTDRVLAAFDAGGPVSGLVTGWSAFEAAARHLLPDHFSRPQPSARLLEMLASEGYVTPDEADALRGLAVRRNQAAHGRLDIEVERAELENLIKATRTLLDPAT